LKKLEKSSINMIKTKMAQMNRAQEQSSAQPDQEVGQGQAGGSMNQQQINN